MKAIVIAVVLFFLTMQAGGQTAEEIILQVKQKLDRVNDYEAKGKMKTNVVFIKAPVATVRIYYKKPDRLRVKNESGISFIPKGTVNINLENVLTHAGNYDVIDMGKESGTGLRTIKLLPRDENADVVLSTLYVDEKQMLVKKARTTTRENGTYELEMSYGKYAEYGLADKIIFSFNTKDYKLPKGVTFDYDDGKQKDASKLKNKKGKVEITYTSYKINGGLPDSVFQ
jgi:outer membrane lipoprotein-sorting protein